METKQYDKELSTQGLEKGKDYLELPVANPKVKAYIPLNYRAAKIIASANIGASVGHWLVAHPESDWFWKAKTTSHIIIYIIKPRAKCMVSVSTDRKSVDKFNEFEIFTGGIKNKLLSADALYDTTGIKIKEFIQANWGTIKKAEQLIA